MKMKEQNEFKEAMNEIPVPTEKLDEILKSSFHKKKQARFLPFKRLIKYGAAVVLLSVGMITSANLSPAFANVLTQIPIMGHAFEYFIMQDDYYEAYEEISTNIGLSSTSNGVNMTIEQAFYDGNTITLGFVVHAGEEEISLPTFENFPSVEGKSVGGLGYEGEYIDGVGFVGMMTISSVPRTDGKIHVAWKPKAIELNERTVKGDWKFDFTLEPIDGEYVLVNEQVQDEGVTVTLIDGIQTDVNFTINYTQKVDPSVLDRWSAVEAELFAIDDLGNEYEVPYNSGTGTLDGETSEDFTWNATLHGLDPEATSLTFYPFAHLSNIGDDFIRVDFDPIVVELK